MHTPEELHDITVRSTAVALAVELMKSGKLAPTQALTEIASKIADYIENGTVTPSD